MARLLIIVSSARSIDLVSDREHPTGYFADEVLKPYDKFLAAGVEVAFATVDGPAPQADPYGLQPLFRSRAASLPTSTTSGSPSTT
jgi:putative intracellular protease/amidase